MLLSALWRMIRTFGRNLRPEKRKKWGAASVLLMACFVAGFSAGCSGTKAMTPNAPYDGDLPPTLRIVAGINPMFVHEVRKLPSISDGLLPPETEAVEIFARIFMENPDAFGLAFERMNQIGNPETRAYCTPLQAMYWLVAEGRDREVVDLVADYCLDELLDRAWGLPPDLVFPGEKLEKLVLGMKTSRQVREHIHFLLNQGRYTLAMRLVYSFFGNTPNGFDSASWYTLAPKFELYQEWYLETRHRWANFSFVTERLNSPELVNYYQQLYFDHIIPGLQSERPEDVFTAKKGDGWDFSLFAKHCLSQAGYEVQQADIGVTYTGAAHWTTVYRDHGGWYILDNAFRADVICGIQGPFENPEAAVAIYR
jgi:hypothetical protein